MSKPQKRFVSM